MTSRGPRGLRRSRLGGGPTPALLPARPLARAMLTRRPGLTKRFGGFIALNNVSFEVARGRDPRAHRAQRVRQDDVLQLHLRRAGADARDRSASAVTSSAASRPTRSATAGSRARSRSRGRSASSRSSRTSRSPRTSAPPTRTSEAEARQRAAEVLTLVGLPTDPHADPTPARRRRAQEARARARARHAARSSCSPTRASAASTRREMASAADMLRRVRGELGITIVWVEHIMATLMRVVDRLVVLDHGEKIAEGRRAAIAEDPRVIEAYLGEKVVLDVSEPSPRGAAPMLELAGSARATATSPRCGTSRCASTPGEAVAVVGPNGAGKTTLLRVISGVIAAARRHARLRGRAAHRPARARDRRARHRARARGPAPLPGLTVADNLKMGAFLPSARDALRGERRARLRALPRAEGAARASARAASRAASSRCSRSAAR